MQKTDKTKAGSLRLVLVALVAAASAIWIWARWTFDSGGGDADGGGTSPVAAVADPEQDSTGPRPADYTLRFGESMQISAAALPNDRPVELALVLAEPAAGVAPLSLRILDGNGRELRLHANISGDDRMSASLKIEPGWLSPGAYLIHLRTTERTHFPLRRYPFVVR